MKYYSSLPSVTSPCKYVGKRW